MVNISPSGDATSGALIEAENAQFWASFPAILHRPLIYPCFRQFAAVVSSQKGAIFATHVLYMIPLKIWEITVDISSSEDDPSGSLIAAKNAPFWAPFPPILQSP